MISIENDIAEEIIRIANSYAEELHNALGTLDNSDEMIHYMESDIANADSLVTYIKRKLGKS